MATVKQAKTRFHLGVYGESFISDSFAVQPELMYSQQGYKITNANGTFTQQLDYINLPIMLKAYPAPNFSRRVHK
jgi:hypothetical protein